MPLGKLRAGEVQLPQVAQPPGGGRVGEGTSLCDFPVFLPSPILAPARLSPSGRWAVFPGHTEEGTAAQLTGDLVEWASPEDPPLCCHIGGTPTAARKAIGAADFPRQRVRVRCFS